MKKGAFSYFSYLKGLTLQFSVFQLCSKTNKQTNNMEGNNMDMAIWKLQL